MTIEKEESTRWNPPSTNSFHHSPSTDVSTVNQNEHGGDNIASGNLFNASILPVGHLDQEKDHNSNLSKTPAEGTETPPPTPDVEQYSALTPEQLVAELVKAHARIQELESAQAQVSPCPSMKSDNFSFGKGCSSDECDFYENCLAVINEQKRKSFRRPRKSCYNPDDFTVAYQHKGTFPPCDTDLSDFTDHASEDEEELYRDIIFENGVWENDLVKTILNEPDDEDDEDSEIEDNESFPLIPSPVLDTPPYEYIFLTRENEAKFRIFLNAKLNKVFHQELLKLQKQEEEHKRENDHVDVHNQNHLINCPSSVVHDVKGAAFAGNVIHCFDPSDVDLELKRIFTEKPPITHRIDRRRSRKDRGSSVPAVDSYYGTSDLSKVGHASYFIPSLTESERKAIGWKPDYYFGHWKYAAMNVPNIRTNPTPLHPHLDDKATTHSKSHHHHHHHHHHPQDALLAQNPLHQKEINFSDPFIFESDTDSANADNHHRTKPTTSCKHEIHKKATAPDSLSFITLSGDSAAASSHSCHIIRDRCALMRILRWILPTCIRTQESSVPSSDPSNTSNCPSKTEDLGLKEVSEAPHEIETLAEAQDKLAFAVSHTHITFAEMKSGQGVPDDKNNNRSQNWQKSAASQAVSEKSCKNAGKSHHHEHHHHHHHHREGKSHSHHHHNQHHRTKDDPKHHSHHHGLFHWKHMLNLKDSTSNDSLNVVGGDVLVSSHGSGSTGTGIEFDQTPAPVEKDNLQRRNTLVGDRPASLHSLADDSFTDDTDSEVDGEVDDEKQQRLKLKQRKKLKPSKAYSKLLTLKDLGYQTENSDAEEAKPNKPKTLTASVSASSSEIETVPNHSPKPQDLYQEDSNRFKRRRKREELEEKCLKVRNRLSNNSSDTTGNDGDDDFSSCGSATHPFSPQSVSEQDSIATTHFYYDGSGNISIADSSSVYFPKVSSSGSCGGNVHTRFLDQKDLLLPKYQETLPFIYDLGDSVTGTDSNSLEEDGQEGVIEWVVDKDFQEIEEGLGLLNSCLDIILNNGKLAVGPTEVQEESQPPSNEDVDVPDKVDGQHRIITLNELENDADVENMNRTRSPHNNVNVTM